MRFALPFAACAFLLGTEAMAQTRLTDQYVRGWRRICSYEDLRPSPAGTRTDRRTYALQVGRGEPCPFRYSAPLPERPRTPARRSPARAGSPLSQD